MHYEFAILDGKIAAKTGGWVRSLPNEQSIERRDHPTALTRRANHFSLSEAAPGYVKPSSEKHFSSVFRKDMIICPHPVAIERGVATVTALEAGSGGRVGLV